MSEAEDWLVAELERNPIPGWDLVREHRFHPTRRWRWDLAFPSQRLAVEIDGRGRHQTVVGVRADCEKLNEAVRLGWRVLRFPASDKKQVAQWAELIRECLLLPPSSQTEWRESRPHKTRASARWSPTLCSSTGCATPPGTSSSLANGDDLELQRVAEVNRYIVRVVADPEPDVPLAPGGHKALATDVVDELL
jgi:very-short-patch-repair endonuclease